MSRDAAFSPILKKKSADLRFTWYRIDSTRQYKNEKDSNMKKIIVIGGGAAGMAAAIAAAENGCAVTIYEKNEKLGKKIYITGKGRCNVTNDCDMEGLFDSVVTNSRFLYSAFYGFTNQDMKDFLEVNGCHVKVERGNRVFPVSDRASDVTSALARRLRELRVKVELNQGVRELWLEDGVLQRCDSGAGR
jgi:predicted Rossmann fold flavoprotein